MKQDVGHGAMGHWINPVWLFLVPASDPRLVLQWYALSSLWDGACTRTLAANQKE